MTSRDHGRHTMLPHERPVGRRGPEAFSGHPIYTHIRGAHGDCLNLAPVTGSGTGGEAWPGTAQERSAKRGV
jgi:hypothetical protein